MISNIKKKDFLCAYNINHKDFDRSGLKWRELLEIKKDFESKKEKFESAMRSVVDVVSGFKKVHSVRYRVKESDHLVEKIIRKKIENRKRELNIDTYTQEIKDLIGVRLLHLYKDDFYEIHKQIKEHYEFVERPTVNLREGDSVELWNNVLDNPNINEHKYGYRSVHYIIKTKPTKATYFVEIQLRTIFEEGWSEIDHDIRYPYELDNKILLDYLLIFNRLAGSADEMGTFIKQLANHMKSLNEVYHKEIQLKDSKIEELNTLIEALKIDRKEKERLESKVRELSENSSHFSTRNPFFDSNPASSVAFTSPASLVNNYEATAYGYHKRCSSCGKLYNNPISVVASSRCPSCGAINW